MVKEVLMKAYLYNIFSALILKLVPEKYLGSAHTKKIIQHSTTTKNFINNPKTQLRANVNLI
jgi:hypothetical protein